MNLLPWLAVAYAATGFYSVRQNEQAVVRRCGRVLPELRGPGLHFGFPYGVDKVDRVKALESKQVGVGIDLTQRALGRRVEPRRAEGLTGDRNLILISAVIQYRIADPKAYLFRAGDVPKLVHSAAASALSSVIASMNVDDVLTVRRTAIRGEVIRRAQQTLDRYRVGVTVTSVSLEGLAAPQEVAHAFRDVNSAREDRFTAVNEAKGYQSEVLPQAQGKAYQMREEAEAFGGEVVRKADGDAQRFARIAAEVSSSRELTEKRLILETMEEVLPRLRKIVVDDGEGRPVDLGIIEEQP